MSQASFFWQGVEGKKNTTSLDVIACAGRKLLESWVLSTLVSICSLI
jgi:hypothetical protein